MPLGAQRWRPLQTCLAPDYGSTFPTGSNTESIMGRADVATCVVGERFDRIFAFGMMMKIETNRYPVYR